MVGQPQQLCTACAEILHSGILFDWLPDPGLSFHAIYDNHLSFDLFIVASCSDFIFLSTYLIYIHVTMNHVMFWTHLHRDRLV